MRMLETLLFAEKSCNRQRVFVLKNQECRNKQFKRHAQDGEVIVKNKIKL